MPDFDALRENLVDAIAEGQLKLGYSDAPVSLNYPADSLNRLLGTQLSFEELGQALREFRERVRVDLGDIGVSQVDGRYCLTVPQAGTRYVHGRLGEKEFLREFIDLMRDPHGGVTIEEILRVFWKYSDQVCCIPAQEEEFNYLVYFANGVPDDYRYLIQIELGHATYHRMTPGDYEAMGFRL